MKWLVNIFGASLLITDVLVFVGAVGWFGLTGMEPHSTLMMCCQYWFVGFVGAAGWVQVHITGLE